MTSQFTNHLARETSPYLLQHQHNPIDWYPWGPDAFAKAKRENKAIFLSIGYSTCHWCHVMAHESFENPAIAAIFNKHFVCIKVDREERPDIDRLYMAFVQNTTGSGGWPMSVWLTPDGMPFFGGTYFPPEDRYGRLGLPVLLHRLAYAWQKDQEQLRRRGVEILNAIRDISLTNEPAPDAEPAQILDNAFKKFSETFDTEWGGFGYAPKFPQATVFSFLFAYHVMHKKSDDGNRAKEMALSSLKKMATGGIRDHIGGGFHRYSVDAQWHVPHFEKMLYDQAQLAMAYLDAFLLTQDPSFSETARSILNYVRRDLTHPKGGFFSAEDADSSDPTNKTKSREGAFYVWTRDEIEQHLDPLDARIFCSHYGVEPNGNVAPENDPHGEFRKRNILFERRDPSATAKLFNATEDAIIESLAQSRMTLLEARDQRARPHLDEKIITAWNGLMISAFAKAAAIFQEDVYLHAARAAADFLSKYLSEPDMLYRSWCQKQNPTPGFAEDYAFLIQGLIDLYSTDFDFAHIEWAQHLQEIMNRLFWDEKTGSFYNSTAHDPLVRLRMKDQYDGAEPAAGSVASMNLFRLGYLLRRQDWIDQSHKITRSVEGILYKLPQAAPNFLAALQLQQKPPRQIIVISSVLYDEQATLMHREIHRRFLPATTILDIKADRTRHRLPDWAQALHPVRERATVYLCQDFVCRKPITDIKALRSALDGES